MTTVERDLQDVRVIFSTGKHLHNGPAITVPGVWQIRCETSHLATVTFMAGGGASLVIFEGERVTLAAHCLEPGQPYYYVLTLTDAPVCTHQDITQDGSCRHCPVVIEGIRITWLENHPDAVQEA